MHSDWRTSCNQLPSSVITERIWYFSCDFPAWYGTASCSGACMLCYFMNTLSRICSPAWWRTLQSSTLISDRPDTTHNPNPERLPVLVWVWYVRSTMVLQKPSSVAPWAQRLWVHADNKTYDTIQYNTIQYVMAERVLWRLKSHVAFLGTMRQKQCSKIQASVTFARKNRSLLITSCGC